MAAVRQPAADVATSSSEAQHEHPDHVTSEFPATVPDQDAQSWLFGFVGADDEMQWCASCPELARLLPQVEMEVTKLCWRNIHLHWDPTQLTGDFCAHVRRVCANLKDVLDLVNDRARTARLRTAIDDSKRWCPVCLQNGRKEMSKYLGAEQRVCKPCSVAFTRLVLRECKILPEVRKQQRMFQFMSVDVVLRRKKEAVKALGEAGPITSPVKPDCAGGAGAGTAYYGDGRQVKRPRLSSGAATEKGGATRKGVAVPAKPLYHGTSLILVRMDSGGRSCERTVVPCLPRCVTCVPAGTWEVRIQVDNVGWSSWGFGAYLVAPPRRTVVSGGEPDEVGSVRRLRLQGPERGSPTAQGGLVEHVDFLRLRDDPQLRVAKLQPGASVQLVLIAAQWHAVAKATRGRMPAPMRNEWARDCARAYGIRVMSEGLKPVN